MHSFPYKESYYGCPNMEEQIFHCNLSKVHGNKETPYAMHACCSLMTKIKFFTAMYLPVPQNADAKQIKLNCI